jgi:2-polyprenyl-3-methyl-5-hydroxy-6-metoxy-1,4-benzoquinol methylase
MATHSTARVQDLIAGLVRGQRVLDIGCVEHAADRATADTWLHAHLVRHAAHVVGVDILEADVAQLRARGYDVMAADAMQLDMGQRFDVVVAGELIEHLTNPGQFLDRMRAHLDPGGRLILTTPHAFFAYHILEGYLCRPSRRWNPQHVAWYEPFTLANLLTRHGFTMTECRYVTRSRKLRATLRALRLPCWGWLASTLLIVAQRDGAVR